MTVKRTRLCYWIARNPVTPVEYVSLSFRTHSCVPAYIAVPLLGPHQPRYIGSTLYWHKFLGSTGPCTFCWVFWFFSEWSLSSFWLSTWLSVSRILACITSVIDSGLSLSVSLFRRSFSASSILSQFWPVFSWLVSRVCVPSWCFAVSFPCCECVSISSLDLVPSLLFSASFSWSICLWLLLRCGAEIRKGLTLFFGIFKMAALRLDSLVCSRGPFGLSWVVFVACSWSVILYRRLGSGSYFVFKVTFSSNFFAPAYRCVRHPWLHAHCEFASIRRCHVAWGKFSELLPIHTSCSFPITIRKSVQFIWPALPAIRWYVPRACALLDVQCHHQRPSRLERFPGEDAARWSAEGGAHLSTQMVWPCRT